MKRLDPNWDVAIVLDNLRSGSNVGNIFRLAEALSARVIGCGYTPMPPHPVVAKTAMHTDETVPCSTAANVSEAVRQLKSEGFKQVLAVEITDETVEVWDFPEYQMPLALILGNEALGVSSEALELCDGVIGLPMLGSKASINVSNAAAAVLYAIASRFSQ